MDLALHHPTDEIMIPAPGSRFAYVFYATNDQYAMSAAVACLMLRKLGALQHVDSVLLYSKVSEYVLRAARQAGLRTKRVSSPSDLGAGYFRHSLLKLRVLQLVQYERIVFMDSDALPRAPLHDLFTMPLAAPVAAPRAYWIARPKFTTALFVTQPSLQLWNRVSRHFRHAAERQLYDMDIFNLEFGRDVHRLPDEYLGLNSEWEDRTHPFHFGDPDDSYARVKLVHFSALGKPWSYSPAEARRLRPSAHRCFFDCWDQWWALRDEIVASRPLVDRLFHSRLIRSSRKLNRESAD